MPSRPYENNMCGKAKQLGLSSYFFLTLYSTIFQPGTVNGCAAMTPRGSHQRQIAKLSFSKGVRSSSRRFISVILRTYKPPVSRSHFAISSRSSKFAMLANAVAPKLSLASEQTLPSFSTFLVLFTVATLVSHLIYNRYFHSLRHFPGPFWGSLTDAFHTYLMWRKTSHTEQLAFHEKYGSYRCPAPHTEWQGLIIAQQVPFSA